MKRNTIISFCAIILFVIGCSSACKNSDITFDITGKWRVRETVNWADGSDTKTVEFIVTFSGNYQSGRTSSGANSGSYSVDGQDIEYSLSGVEGLRSFVGAFVDSSYLSGTITVSYQNLTWSGTWSATRFQ